jgi:hypothetical protein
MVLFLTPAVAVLVAVVPSPSLISTPLLKFLILLLLSQLFSTIVPCDARSTSASSSLYSESFDEFMRIHGGPINAGSCGGKDAAEELLLLLSLLYHGATSVGVPWVVLLLLCCTLVVV